MHLNPVRLQVPDLRIASTPLFTSVSVTAERWVALEEVPVPQLPHWLSEARAQVTISGASGF